MKEIGEIEPLDLHAFSAFKQKRIEFVRQIFRDQNVLATPGILRHVNVSGGSFGMHSDGSRGGI